MITAYEVRRIAGIKGIDPGIVEKDYVLTKVLFTISVVGSLRPLVLKGGTALRYLVPELPSFDVVIEEGRRPVAGILGERAAGVEPLVSPFLMSYHNIGQTVDQKFANRRPTHGGVVLGSGGGGAVRGFDGDHKETDQGRDAEGEEGGEKVSGQPPGSGAILGQH